MMPRLQIRPHGLFPGISFGGEPSNSTGGSFTHVAASFPGAHALRHSHASYRLAEVNDAQKVALEMGNSPRKLFENYRQLVTPAAATKWFAILPEKKRSARKRAVESTGTT